MLTCRLQETNKEDKVAKTNKETFGDIFSIEQRTDKFLDEIRNICETNEPNKTQTRRRKNRNIRSQLGQWRC